MDTSATTLAISIGAAVAVSGKGATMRAIEDADAVDHEEGEDQGWEAGEKQGGQEEEGIGETVIDFKGRWTRAGRNEGGDDAIVTIATLPFPLNGLFILYRIPCVRSM
jgi:hypothetical protein